MGSPKLYCVENIPGLLGSLLDLQRSHDNQFNKYIGILEKNDLKSEFLRAKEIRLDPFFMRSLIFYSNEIYFPLLSDDRCSLYSLIENNLLKTSEGNIKNVGVVFKTKEGRQISALVEKKVFIDYVYQNECPNQKDLSILYSEKNFPKTFKTFTLERPKTYQTCLEQFEKVKKSQNTPYLCKIPKTIKEGLIAEKILLNKIPNEEKRMLDLSRIVREKNFYIKNTNLFDQNYLQHLCQNLNDRENFCTFFRADDAWSQVVFGDLPSYKIDFKCIELLKLNKLPNKDQIALCAEKFKNKPETCQTLNGGYALYPSYSCDTLSSILKHSQLKTAYRDCPSKIDNDSVTNLYRIFQHFNSKGEVTSDINVCINNSYREALKVLSKNNNDFSNWPLRMCYTDPKKTKEECLPYVPGSDKESTVSETKVLNQILQTTKGANSKEDCIIVSEKDYNPVRLEYRNSCYIIINPDACSSFYCPRKIIYRNEEQKNIRYEGMGTIDYFPNQPGNSFNTAVAALKRKLGVKFEELRSLSEIIRFFSKYKNGIAHGIGCLEDFYPHLFKKDSLNSCRPIPFILDGILKDKNKKVWIIFRSTIDDVHGPHLIHWNHLYSGIKSYEEVHPLKTWTLYGIKK